MIKDLVIFCTTLFFAAAAVAQEVPEPPRIPPGEDQIEYLAAGERTPYDGMLLSMDTAIRWTNRMRWWPETFRLRLAEEEEIRTLEARITDERVRIITESYEREIEGLRGDLRTQAQQYTEELAQLRNPPFWQRNWFGFVMGVVLVGAAVLIGALLAIQ
jgi:hypothetical protein